MMEVFVKIEEPDFIDDLPLTTVDNDAKAIIQTCLDRKSFKCNVCGSYEKATKKLKIPEITSDLSSGSGTETECILSLPSILSSPDLLTSPCSTSGTPTVQDHENFQRSVFRILEEIRQEQKEIKNEIGELRRLFNSSGATLTNSTPSDCVDLPVNSTEKLRDLDAYLEDVEKFNQLCSYFGGIGGGTAPAIVRNILSMVVSNDLSKLYNWKGTGGVKLAFCKFKNIGRLITSSVRQHRGYEKTTEAEIQLTIKKWLAYANDRQGGRASRKKL